MKRSKVNKANRQKNKVNHRGGSKSFVRHRHDQRNLETNEEPTRVEFYRNMRYNKKKGWIHPQAEENYVRMVEIRSQPLQEGFVAPTDDEIVDNVLGVKSGYVLGLGRGELAPSRSDLADNHSEVVQLRRRAEEAEIHLQELREEQVAQHQAMATTCGNPTTTNGSPTTTNGRTKEDVGANYDAVSKF